MGLIEKKANANNKRYKATVKGKQAAARHRRGRRAAHRLAKPVWANKVAIDDIYEEAKEAGITVDHIVPLQSDRVCGLHWEGNMQLLTIEENQRKNNFYWPNM